MEDPNKKIIEAAIEILKYIETPTIVKSEVLKIIKLASGI